MSETDILRPYHIGGRGPHRFYWAHRWHADMFFRSWQSEAPYGYGLRFARRGWTPGMARALMAYDLRWAKRGRLTMHQRRRTWWADR